VNFKRIVIGSSFGIVMTAALMLTAGTVHATTLPSQGGVLNVDVPTGVINPCNGEEVVTGTASTRATVLVLGAGGFSRVGVLFLAHGDFASEDQLQQYELLASASAQFDTRALASYTIPIKLRFRGQNGASDFAIFANVIISIDQNQRPVAVSVPGTGGQCGL
jgi:hypothetical protein